MHRAADRHLRLRVAKEYEKLLHWLALAAARTLAAQSAATGRFFIFGRRQTADRQGYDPVGRTVVREFNWLRNRE